MKFTNLIHEGILDTDLYGKEIISIKQTNDYSLQEIYYRKIGISILKSLKGYDLITEFTSKLRGVPFDIIFIHANTIGLVELKGSLKHYNKPDKTQLARFKTIYEVLQSNNYQLNGYLLQINIEKSTFRICDLIKIIEGTNLSDYNLGQKTPIDKIISEFYNIIKKPAPNN